MGLDGQLLVAVQHTMTTNIVIFIAPNHRGSGKVDDKGYMNVLIHVNA